MISLGLAAYLGFALVHLPHDKIIHFTTFFILTLEFYWLWKLPTKYVRLLTVTVCTLMASVVSEMVQGMINPSRVYDVGDIYANIAGSFSAIIVSEVVGLFTKREKRDSVGV